MNLNKGYILIIFILVILFLLYTKQKEEFTNFTKNYFNYQNLIDNSSSPWVYNEKHIDELSYIISLIINEINNKLNSKFIFTNISSYDNIKKVELDNKTNYIVDIFVFEENRDFTIKLIMDFTVLHSKNGNKIQINNITKSNAIKFNSDTKKNNNLVLDSVPFEQKIIDLENIKNKFNVIGINAVNENILEYSPYNNNNGKEVPTPMEFQRDILPLSIQEDTKFKEKKNKQINEINKICDKKKRCWDCSGVRTSHAKKCSCNSFQRENEPLEPIPSFNPSLHKHLSDKKNNDWLFRPTRIEIDHNY